MIEKGNEDRRRARMIRLFGDRQQRLVQRHPRLHQRRELSRGERDLARRHPRPRERVAAIRRSVDGGGRETIGAQTIARGARRFGVEQAVSNMALRVDGLPAKRGHANAHWSRVTRTTSESDVAPALTQRAPSARNVRIPARVAAARSASSPAPS